MLVAYITCAIARDRSTTFDSRRTTCIYTDDGDHNLTNTLLPTDNSCLK